MADADASAMVARSWPVRVFLFDDCEDAAAEPLSR
jgi:hypothetical protein